MLRNLVLCFVLFGIGTLNLFLAVSKKRPKWLRWIAWPVAGACWLYALLLSG